MRRLASRFGPMIFGTFVLLARVLTAAEVDSVKTSPPECAFLHASVIPMTEKRVLLDQTVLTANGKIAQIGPSKTLLLPRGTCKIEARGKFLIPGLADAHTHLLSPIELPLYLANGVTTVFNLDGHPAHLLWRKEINRGEMVGPSIFTTGPLFQRTRSAEEDVHLVDEQADAGYDGVKIYVQVSKAEYPALIAEAKKRNLLLMGHVAREPDFELTVRSGQSIAHLEEFTYTFFNPQHDGNDTHIVYDESRIPEAVKLTKDAGVFVTPTLFTYATIVQQATDIDSFLKNPDLKYLPPWTQAQYQPAANRYKNGFAPAQYQQLRASLAFQRKLLKALFDAGVPLMCGTDAPEVGPLPGFGTHDELQEFVNDGLTPYQALQTATVNVARYLRHSNEFGTIEVGKQADLVLLDGNPLVAISNTRRIAGVMVRGQWMPHAQLSSMMAEVPATYQRDLRLMKSELQSDPAAALKYLRENDPYLNVGQTAMSELAAGEGFDQVPSVVRQLRVADPKSELVSEQGINKLGYNLVGEKKYKKAIAVFQMNTQDFPKSANVYDSLGETQFKAGDLPHARENYRKALEADPKYPNAKTAAKFLEDHNQQ